jgi:hypothetical protein
VVASVKLDDSAGLAGEVALQSRWCAFVLSADEIGRGHLLPGRGTYGLCRHVHALPRELVCSLGLGGLLKVWLPPVLSFRQLDRSGRRRPARTRQG